MAAIEWKGSPDGKREFASERVSIAKCKDCDFKVAAANAQGAACRHTDASGHETTVEITMSIRYRPTEKTKKAISAKAAAEAAPKKVAKKVKAKKVRAKKAPEPKTEATPAEPVAQAG